MMDPEPVNDYQILQTVPILSFYSKKYGSGCGESNVHLSVRVKAWAGFTPLARNVHF